MELLEVCPYFRRPSKPFKEGEVWLCVDRESAFPDIRLFPSSVGFFLEITSLPKDLSQALHNWITQLQHLGECTIIDNDTEEVVELSSDRMPSRRR